MAYKKLPIRIFVKFLLSISTLILFALAPAKVYAQCTSTATVDGNPCDWPSILSVASRVSTPTTDPINDANDNRLSSGAKDVNDIPLWTWANSPVDDKADINHGAVALLGNTLWFAADRYAQNGDADIAFWLFKSSVFAKTDGSYTFSGQHTVGDLLITSNFVNGGGTATITVYEWVGGSNPLSLLGYSGAAVNTSEMDVPSVFQNFTAKFGTLNKYPAGAFFEGSVNLSNFSGLDPCFTSFLLETGESQANTEQLVDFLGGQFSTKPVVSLNNTTICSGGTATFTATVQAGTGIAPFTYTFMDGSTTLQSGSSNQLVLSNQTGTRTITVIATGSNGCSSEPATGVLTVNPVPACSITGGNSICSGSTTSFSGPSGMTTYSWVGPNGFIAGTQSTGNISNAGTYTLTITNSYGCSSTCFRTLTVNQTPTVTVNSPSRCPEAGTVSITSSPNPATAAAGVYTYTWQVPAGVTNPGNVASFQASVAGIYTVTIVDGNGCTATGAGTLTVYGAATVSATATPATINLFSADHNSLLNAYGSVNGVQNNALFTSFTWSSVLAPGFENGSSGLSSTSGATVTFTAPNTFNVNYKFLVNALTANGCTASATVIVSTNGAFSCPGITGPSMICSGSTATFTASGSIPQYTHYDWVAQGATINGSTHDVTSVSVTPTGAGTYTVSIRVSFDNTLIGTVTCTTTATAVDCSLSGCTIGYWKNHPAVWDSYTDPIIAGQVSGTTIIYPGMPAGTAPGQEFITTTIFKTYFALTSNPSGIPAGSTMLQVLGLQGGNCVALARNSVAALLSKAAFGSSYPFNGSFSDLYNTIRTVLSGGASSWTCSTLNDALNTANNNEFNGNCSALGAPGATPTVLNNANPDRDALVNKLSVIAAPNPFYNKVKFFISSPEAGHMQLDVMNILGQRIANVYDGNIQANSIQEVEFTVPASAPQNLMYLLRMGNQKVTGKLLHINQ